MCWSADNFNSPFQLLRSKSVKSEGPGDWTKPAPLHWCRGCCGSRAQAVEKMFMLTSQVVVGHTLGTPAENKWGSVLPACQDVVLLSGFYCLLPVVEHAMNGRRLPGVVKGGPLPADYGIAENFEQTRRERQMRVAKFIHSPTSKARLLTYLLLVKSPVRLHFRLFRDAFGLLSSTLTANDCHQTADRARCLVPQLTISQVASSLLQNH